MGAGEPMSPLILHTLLAPSLVAPAFDRRLASPRLASPCSVGTTLHVFLSVPASNAWLGRRAPPPGCRTPCRWPIAASCPRTRSPRSGFPHTPCASVVRWTSPTSTPRVRAVAPAVFPLSPHRVPIVAPLPPAAAVLESTPHSHARRADMKAYRGGELLKAPSDSLTTWILPFASDPALREEYVNFAGQVR